MKAVMLILTERCNLACRYCYESSKKYDMSFDMAKKFIDREMQEQCKEDFKIFFFGGEPFLRFDILKRVYDYTEEMYPDRIKSYAVTTNGTLIHGEIRDWLYEHREKFEITLSLDGTQKMHDRNRISRSGEGSFHMIDLNFFRRTWPGCTVKMTISPDTLKDFAEGIIYLEGLGFKCKANFASGVDFKLQENRETVLQNFRKLIDYYSVQDGPLCYMLDLPLKAVLVPLDDKFRYCGAGVERHCYSACTDDWYPCQGLMPMSTGGEGVFKKKTFQESCVKKDSPCAECKMVRICRTCYAMNYNASENIYRTDSQICILNKICMITSARIQYTRLKNKGIRDNRLERAIYIIAKELNEIFA